MIAKQIFGRTGLEVTRLALGGIPLTGTDHSVSDAIINRALDAGVNFVEMSSAYGNGVSEQKFGRVLKDRRADCYVHSRAIVKTGDEMLEKLHQSLRNLQTDCIDIYGIHDINCEVGRPEGFLEDQIDALQRARDDGKIRFLAVSGHRKNDLVKAIETDAFDVVMVAVNPLDADIPSTILPVARHRNIGSIAMKAFAGGHFTDMPELSLRYALARDVTTVSVGVKNLDELNQNINVAETFTPLSDDEAEALRSEAAATLMTLGRYICRQCGYCLRDDGCPVGIDIPRLFEMERQAKRYYSLTWAKAEYQTLDATADLCTECGKCEERCPYDLPIRQKLKDVHDYIGTE